MLPALLAAAATFFLAILAALPAFLVAKILLAFFRNRTDDKD